MESLKTELKRRDEHMRKYIFRTPDGQHPDLRLSAKQAECSPAAGGASTCVASRQLAIRGHVAAILDPSRGDGDGGRFRVSGHGQVALSTYGIERPSQFGVRTDDEVLLHLAFDATSGAAVNAPRSAGR